MVVKQRRPATAGCVAVAAAALAGTALAGAAHAQAPNTTVANVNVLNLLSPFLGLNASPAGQATLTLNLDGTVAINNNAAANPVIAATSISDKSLFGGVSTRITLADGSTAAYGPGANLAGGLPLQAVQMPGTIAASQPFGGLGQLGGAFQVAVSPAGAAVPAVVTLLTTAYNATSGDLGVAKFYFANGTVNGTAAAVAPAGYALPFANGLPNAANSVYDIAYGVTNTGPNQDVYGSSRPVQVAPNRIAGYDPTALTGLATNPSFPSGHTTYAYTDGILTAMLVPQDYQAMLLRASEYGNSRIDLGVHYPLDIIASRSLVQYDLAQSLSGAAGYANLQPAFASAQPALSGYLSSQAGGCGGSVAACAAGNPYNAYSLATYAANTPTAGATLASNADIYKARLAYGLPTLSATAAPADAAPAGGPDASVLLAPVYGGSTAAARAVAPNGGTLGNLATATVNQIIMNSEGNALAAFAGTPLSYWSRVDLYRAAGYFAGVDGALTLAAGDQVLTDVTVANGGTLRGPGATVGTAASPHDLTVAAGGLLSPGTVGETAGGTMTVNGNLTELLGGTLRFGAGGTGAGQYDRLLVSGLASLGGLLDFEPWDGFSLEPGISTFELLSFGASSGGFTGLLFGNSACTATGLYSYRCGDAVTVNELITGSSLSLEVNRVPEPASLGLVLVGVAGVAWGRRGRGLAAGWGWRMVREAG